MSVQDVRQGDGGVAVGGTNAAVAPRFLSPMLGHIYQAAAVGLRIAKPLAITYWLIPRRLYCMACSVLIHLVYIHYSAADLRHLPPDRQSGR